MGSNLQYAQCFVCFLIAALFIARIDCQTQDCPSGCEDIPNPDTPYDCLTLAFDLEACGTALTAGYCQCSCKTCPLPSPPAPPTISQNEFQGWFSINDTQSELPDFGDDSDDREGGDYFEVALTPVIPLQQTLGLSTGGAQGINTFRRSIENGTMPSKSDLTYEGIFSEYYFDFSDGKVCEEILCAKYSAAVSTDPIFNNTERHLAIGLDSGLSQEQFERPNLNLVIVLDHSFSMNQGFGSFEGQTSAERGLKKLSVAKEAIYGMLSHLGPDDNIGLVKFNHKVKVPLELQSGTERQLQKVKNKVSYINAFGGTNIEDALNTAASLIPENDTDRQNRLIVVTDANPNGGDMSIDGLSGIIKRLSKRENPIYTTVIGVGLDFNTTLTDKLTQAKGANYFNVYSPSQLKTKLDEEFDYLVTPLLFDLELKFEDYSLDGEDGWKVLKVSGNPAPFGGLQPSAEVVKVSTLFPTPKSSEGTKGGLILLQVKPNGAIAKPMYIKVSFEDASGKEYEFYSQIALFSNDQQMLKELAESNVGVYGTSAVRKGVLLSRYLNVLQLWLRETEGEDLLVQQASKERFQTFLPYMEEQIRLLNDSTLNKEKELLEELISLAV